MGEPGQRPRPQALRQPADPPGHGSGTGQQPIAAPDRGGQRAIGGGDALQDEQAADATGRPPDDVESLVGLDQVGKQADDRLGLGQRRRLAPQVPRCASA